MGNPDFVKPCNHTRAAPGIDTWDIENINELDLYPVVVVIKRWLHLFKNYRVNVVTENLQVYHMLLPGRSKNLTCMAWLRKLFWIVVIHGMELQQIHIRSEDNVIADTLSRLS